MPTDFIARAPVLWRRDRLDVITFWAFADGQPTIVTGSIVRLSARNKSSVTQLDASNVAAVCFSLGGGAIPKDDGSKVRRNACVACASSFTSTSHL